MDRQKKFSSLRDGDYEMNHSKHVLAFPSVAEGIVIHVARVTEISFGFPLAGLAYHGLQDVRKGKQVHFPDFCPYLVSVSADTANHHSVAPVEKSVQEEQHT